MLVWSAALAAVSIVTSALMFGGSLTKGVAYYQLMASGAFENPTAATDEMAAMQASVLAMQPLILLLTIGWQVLLIGAVYRALLQPDDRKSFYIRLSKQELWLAVASIALVILWVMGVVALVIPLAISFAFGGGVAANVIRGLLILAAIAASVWLMLRLSLAGVMSFSARKLVIFESWSLTRGHAGRMFLVMLAVAGLTLVMEAVVLGVYFGLLMGAVGLDAFSSEPPEVVSGRILPMLFVALPLSAVLGTALYVLMIAPFADVYRQLTQPRPEAA